MPVQTVVDHLLWLFLPAKFLMPREGCRYHHVPGWETVRFVEAQEEVQAVTKATGDVFLGGAGNAFLEALLGPQSVFLLDGERHRLARRIAGEALTLGADASFAAATQRYSDEALDRAASRRLTRLGPWCRALTMRVMCRIVLGVEDEATVRNLFRRFEATTGFSANIVSYTKWMWRPRGPVSIGAVAARIVRRVDEIVYRLITERRAQGPSGQTPLDALIRAQAEHGYDDAFIRDNLVALLAAGYETTGAAVAWMLFWMSQGGVYEHLRGRFQAGDADYLAAFRNECLRYCPPVDILPRKVAAERADAAKQLLPDLAASAKEFPMVCPCVHRIHHDQTLYDEPDRFEPERFVGTTYRSTEYLPFGLGRRFCLGAGVGKQVMDSLLERLLVRGMHFELKDASFRPVRRNVIIWPGAFLYARLRQDSVQPV